MIPSCSDVNLFELYCNGSLQTIWRQRLNLFCACCWVFPPRVVHILDCKTSFDPSIFYLWRKFKKIIWGIQLNFLCLNIPIKNQTRNSPPPRDGVEGRDPSPREGFLSTLSREPKEMLGSLSVHDLVTMHLPSLCWLRWLNEFCFDSGQSVFRLFANAKQKKTVFILIWSHLFFAAFCSFCYVFSPEAFPRDAAPTF